MRGRTVVLIERHPAALVFDVGGGLRQLIMTPEPFLRPDSSEIDPAWVASDGPADVEMYGENYRAYASLLFGATRLMRVANEGGWLEYRPLPLLYTNSLSDLADPSTMQLVARPAEVQGVVDDELLRYAGAYGPGLNMELRSNPRGVEKWL